MSNTKVLRGYMWVGSAQSIPRFSVFRGGRVRFDVPYFRAGKIDFRRCWHRAGKIQLRAFTVQIIKMLNLNCALRREGFQKMDCDDM